MVVGWLWRVRRMRRREWEKELGFVPSGPEKFSKGQEVAGGPGLERAFLLRIYRLGEFEQVP